MRPCSTDACWTSHDDRDTLTVELAIDNDETKKQFESCSSSFADLLKQLACEHDREVEQLRLEIARLSAGDDVKSAIFEVASAHMPCVGDDVKSAILEVASAHRPHVGDEVKSAILEVASAASAHKPHGGNDVKCAISHGSSSHKCPTEARRILPRVSFSDDLDESAARAFASSDDLDELVARERDLNLDQCTSDGREVMPSLTFEFPPVSPSSSLVERRPFTDSKGELSDREIWCQEDAKPSMVTTDQEPCFDKPTAASTDRESWCSRPSEDYELRPSENYELKTTEISEDFLQLGKKKKARLSNQSLMSTDSVFACLSRTLKDNKSLKRWHNLITRVEAARGGTHCVQVDPAWCKATPGEVSETFQTAVLQRSLSDFSLGTYQAVASLASFQSDSDMTFFEKASKNFQRYTVIHPNSSFRVLWDLLGMLLLLHDSVAIPLQVFDSGTDGLGDAYMSFWYHLDIVASVFWTCDILVSFLTGFYSELGFVEERHCTIARHYLRTWFALDFIIVCVDWTGYVLNFESEVGIMRLGKTASRFLRIVRLLRFTKMSERISKILERINSEYVLTLVGVSKLLLGIIMVNHYIACTWYYMSQIESEDTWSKTFLSEQEEMGYAYVTSLHWSLTQFTPASMEVHATNKYERIYTIVVIIAAMVTFSSFVSSITGAMTHLRHINAKKAEQDTAFRQYFSTNKISQELASQVWHFRRHNTKNNKSRVKEADLPAFLDLPDRMQKLLRYEVYSPFLQRHPFFALYSDIYPESIRQICHQAMTERQLSAGEELKDMQSPTDKMLFVCSGMLEYLCEEANDRVSIKQSLVDRKTRNQRKRSGTTNNGFSNEGRKVSHFKVCTGQWACEVSLWSKEGKTSGSFVGSDNGCELIFLQRKKFQLIALKHSEGARLIAKYAETFVQRFNNSCLDPLFHNILFNDTSMACEMVEESTIELLNDRDFRKTTKARQSEFRGRMSTRKSIVFGKRTWW